MNPQLKGIEELADTCPFDLRGSYRARKPNRLLWNLRLADCRERFLTDEAGTCRDIELSRYEWDLVRKRDWLGMIKFGVPPLPIEKIARGEDPQSRNLRHQARREFRRFSEDTPRARCAMMLSRNRRSS
jgi:hypothetical protein